jgi:hypothetical protein
MKSFGGLGGLSFFRKRSPICFCSQSFVLSESRTAESAEFWADVNFSRTIISNESKPVVLINICIMTSGKDSYLKDNSIDLTSAIDNKQLARPEQIKNR